MMHKDSLISIDEVKAQVEQLLNEAKADRDDVSRADWEGWHRREDELMVAVLRAAQWRSLTNVRVMAELVLQLREEELDASRWYS